MKAYGGVHVQIHIFLTSALAGGQLHAPAALPPGKSPRYPLDRRLGGPHIGLDDVEKRKFFTLRGLEHRPFGRPVRS
jgi:hypothetical protein